ncbi:MAG: replicative DNA helicase [Candidatus Electryonea clarkiae]|nr:replicative DNA helicase [Candidatus Electryonea clarkiae]MDP8285188.1 replicative DNA helicase [Candidatus Electryonea clarkiae]
MNEVKSKKKPADEEKSSIQVPPSDLQAEQAVLGAVLLDPTAYAKVIEFVKESSFYWTKHSIIFHEMNTLFNNNEPTDLVAVSNQLKSSDKLDDAGGDYYITELASSVPFPRNVDYYAKIVQEKYLLRQLVELGEDIGSKAFEPSANPSVLLDSSISEIFRLQQTKERAGYQNINEVTTIAVEDLDRISTRKGELIGVTSGFPKLDSITGGFQNSDLIILAARPSMGKTALALGYAYNAAKISRVPVGIISLEMNARQIAIRLLSFETKLSLDKIRKAQLSIEDWSRIAEGASQLSQLPIYIDDSSIQTITDIRARARRLKMQFNVGMIVLDYLQLMQPSDRVENQQQFIANVSRQLKGLAKELDIPIVTLSQLSRKVEDRGGSKRPILSDLRDSGAIEQDADVVMFVYRKAYYAKLEGKEEEANDKTADIIIAKQRNGPTGNVKLTFLEERAIFVPQTRDDFRPDSETTGAPF